MKHDSGSSQPKPSQFRLSGALRVTGIGMLDRTLERIAESVSGLAALDRRYQQLPPARSPREFIDHTFDALDVDYEFDAAEVRQVPESGPAIVVSNHPFGAVEGMILMHLLLRRRDDVRLLVNEHLARIHELDELFIGVNPFETRQAARQNTGPLRESVRWLKAGGVLVLFPAGEVSHLQPRQRRVSDPEWKLTLAALVRMSSAPVVPVYFPGRNSLTFQFAGLLHPRLRTLLIPRELKNKRGRSFPVHIGRPVNASRLRHIGDDRRFVNYLRLRTYMLGDVKNATRQNPFQRFGRSRRPRRPRPLVPAVARERLLTEIAALPEAQRLVRAGDLEVMLASATQAPSMLAEIGRLRELTFREVGEGTGRPQDLDIYDQHYQHLFVWNHAEQEIAGAYRLARAASVLDDFGKRGLYTYSLFKYRRRLLQRLRPAVELGRSFVRPEYQKSYAALMLLWRGIGSFVVKEPSQYLLFGPVSISNEYHPLSRNMLVEFLRSNNFETSLAREVRPRTGLRGLKQARWHRREFADVTDIDTLSEAVVNIENGDKGVPVLLRQYLKLGGSLLGFNVDRKFGNALDGLIMVDLRKAEPKLLERYMGPEQAREFLTYHQAADAVFEKAS